MTMVMNLDEIRENDVVCGGLGHPIDNLLGNIRFRAYCDVRRREYQQLPRGEKKEYYMKIYNYITSTLGGRFIEFDKTTNSWSQVAVKKACVRITARLRAPLFKSARSTWQPPPSTTTKKNSPITAIGAKDVLFGRGSRYYNNKGNIKFRDYCMFMSSAYEACPSSLEKEKLTHQIVSDLVEKKFRFLECDKEKDCWVRVEFGRVRKKVAERLQHSKKCKPKEGIITSRVLTGFLQEERDVTTQITNVLDNMLLYPSKPPTTPGMQGINAMVDMGPYNLDNVNVNIDRKNTYIRNEFGMPTGEGQQQGTVRMTVYGTGSGSITHGTSPCTLSFRPFDSDMKKIASALKQFLMRHIDNENNYVDFRDFNLLSFICYEGIKAIKPHRDNVYCRDGSWNNYDNSQVRYTPVATIVYGNERKLQFQLYRHRDPSLFPEDALDSRDGPIKIGDPIVFELKHGDVFYLDPRTEELQWRRHYYSKARTFFKHFCDGVEGMKGLMSLGLVFRVGKNHRDVFADTGMLALTKEEERIRRGRHTKRIRTSRQEIVQSCLKDFLESDSKRDDDKRRKEIWIRLKTKFSILA